MDLEEKPLSPPSPAGSARRRRKGARYFKGREESRDVFANKTNGERPVGETGKEPAAGAKENGIVHRRETFSGRERRGKTVPAEVGAYGNDYPGRRTGARLKEGTWSPGFLKGQCNPED